MSSIRKITAATTPVPYDLAQKIGINGINEIISVLWQGYHAMKTNPSIVVTITSEEDDITQEWFVGVQRLWDSRNRATSICLNGLVPMHQYADNTMKKRNGAKAPTIDFCFKDWSTDNSYFGAEAKNLYNNRTDKIQRYVETGIDNYISGRYGSESSESSVIGYVLSGKVADIVNELRAEIAKGSYTANLSRTMSTADPQYTTKHMRTFDNKEIIIHHLFFNFAA